jgi:hypothetical protein
MEAGLRAEGGAPNHDGVVSVAQLARLDRGRALFMNVVDVEFRELRQFRILRSSGSR